MSRARWVLSGLLLLHLSAMALGAIPAPSTLGTIVPQHRATNDPFAARLTAPIDAWSALVYRSAAAIWNATTPLPQLARLYLQSMGLGQQWTMFWDPPKQDEYVRMRYYVGTTQGASAEWSATEIVFPAQPDDEPRLVSSYWTKRRDKAVFTALDRFLRRRPPPPFPPDARPADLPNDLQPVGRYFARRFGEAHLANGERLLRTEIWFGTAPIPLRGAASDQATLSARFDTLRPYYVAPVEDHFPGDEYPPYYAFEREGDISWLLEYFEEP